MTEQALDDLLASFESGTLPHANWTHAAHLAVAGCYLTAHPRDEALVRMREGVIRYNEAVGTKNTDHSGYHETITRFWIEVASKFLAAQPAASTRAERLNALVEEFAPRRDLFREYWTFDILKSPEARAGWAPPDRKSLSF